MVMTGEGGLVEVQATAERTPLSRAHLDDLLAWRPAASTRCARCRRARRSDTSEPVARRSCSRPTTPTSCGSSSGCSSPPGSPSSRCPTSGPAARGRDTFADNALPKARAAAAAAGRAPSPTTPGSRRRARRPARGAFGSFRRPRGDRSGEPGQAHAGGARGQRLRYVCALAYVDPGAASSTWSSAPAPAPWPPRREAPRALAMTRPSSLTGTTAGARWPSSPMPEGRHQPPGAGAGGWRTGLAADAGALGGTAG